VLVLKVDLSESPALKEKFKVATLPALKFYHKGASTPEEYVIFLSFLICTPPLPYHRTRDNNDELAIQEVCQRLR
jgi:hypothetical protein